MNLEEFKNNAPDIIKMWAEERIDNLVRMNPKLAIVAVYLKRGIKNYIEQQSERLSTTIKQASMFLLEDGRIDIDGLFCDLMNALQDMPETPFSAGPINGNIGKGCVRILMPEGPIWNMLFGDVGSIKITSEDFKALKDMLS